MEETKLDEAITVVAYDPEWLRRFQEERARVAAALGNLAEAIEHIGSTSVTGLPAKPIVDLLVGVRPGVARETVVATLAPLGYEDTGLYLRRRSRQSFNITLVECGGAEWERELLLRDYLRTHPDEARSYGEFKLRVAQSHDRLLAYAREKRPVIGALIERARRWHDLAQS